MCRRRLGNGGRPGAFWEPDRQDTKDRVRGDAHKALAATDDKSRAASTIISNTVDAHYLTPHAQPVTAGCSGCLVLGFPRPCLSSPISGVMMLE